MIDPKVKAIIKKVIPAFFDVKDIFFIDLDLDLACSKGTEFGHF
jgi:hypothetical protein